MKNFKLNAIIFAQAAEYIFHGKKSFKLSTTNLNKNDLEDLLAQLKHGVSESDFFALRAAHPLKLLIERLYQDQLIIPYYTHYENTALEKSYQLLSYFLADHTSPFDFKPDLHAIVIGCGGVGGNIALSLVASGFKRFTLVDYDKVEASNLNRQFCYGANDLGKLKVTALADKILSINPQATVTSFAKKINCADNLSSLVDKGDIIVSGIDTPVVQSSLYTAQYSLAHNIPVIYGAVGYQNIKAGPLLDNTDAKKSYIDYLEKITNVNAEPIPGSLFSTNALLTAIMANNIVSYFYPIAKTPLLNCEWIVDPFSLTYQTRAYHGTH